MYERAQAHPAIGQIPVMVPYFVGVILLTGIRPEDSLLSLEFPFVSIFAMRVRTCIAPRIHTAPITPTPLAFALYLARSALD